MYKVSARDDTIIYLYQCINIYSLDSIYLSVNLYVDNMKVFYCDGRKILHKYKHKEVRKIQLTELYYKWICLGKRYNSTKSDHQESPAYLVFLGRVYR